METEATRPVVHERDSPLAGLLGELGAQASQLTGADRRPQHACLLWLWYVAAGRMELCAPTRKLRTWPHRRSAAGMVDHPPQPGEPDGSSGTSHH